MTWTVLLTSGLGAVAGALLLLRLPGSVFEALVPWLILGTCVLVGVQPRLSAWLKARSAAEGDRLVPGPVTTVFAALTGVYGGYFGAGAGVMMLAVLALGLDLDLRVVNALKTLAVLAANLVASIVFLLLAPLDWPVIALLAAGSVVGGAVGARIGRRLPASVLRVLVVTAGVTAAVVMLVRG